MKLLLDLDRTREEPVYLQICTGLRELIESGALPAGSRLPPTRDVARDLGVNRSTVTAAYDALGALGYVEATVGRGTFVRPEPTSPSPWLARHAGRPAVSAAPGSNSSGSDIPANGWLPSFSRGMESLARYPSREKLVIDHPQPVDFAALFPDEDLFPVAIFRRLMADTLARRGRELLQYAAPEGDPDLRAFIAGELGREDIAVGPDDIVIVNGAQQGIDLLLRVFVDPGDAVVVESPTYWSVLPALGLYRAEIIPVPMTPAGMDVEALAGVLAERRPKLIYTMPNFQNPTGVTMSLETRRTLVQLARQHSIPVVEDDYEKDLRFLGEGVPSLKALDPSGMIMHLGTFSKGLFPGLRLGWIAAPPAVLSRLSLVKRYSDLHTNTLVQAVLAAFCREGHYARHLKKLHKIYRERRSCILDSLERHFPPEATWTRPEGGYALWVTLPPSLPILDLLAEARDEGVVFTPGYYFFDGAERQNGLRLSIARTDPSAIERGTEVLGRLIRARLKRDDGGRAKGQQAAARALPHV